MKSKLALKMKKTVSVALCLAMLTGLTACGEKEIALNIIDDNYRNYYEIYVGSFYDSDGDGSGDLAGVTEKLDYIQDLGFNGIWLMPINQSTTYHKYDVVDYLAIDKDYGTMEDLQTLLDEAHKRGIRVIMDFVINHTSSQNQWFLDACDYLRTLDTDARPDPSQCQEVDWYNFTKEKPNDTYYQVSGTDWYYEGSFWSEMPDLNWKSQTLMPKMKEIAQYYVDMGIDGFRMDAAMHFVENGINTNCQVLNELYTYCCQTNPDFYMVSEVWAGEGTIADYYASETPSMFNFDASGVSGLIEKVARGTADAPDFVDKLIDYQETYSEVYADYIDAPFIANHDQARVANNLVCKEEQMKFAGGLLLTMNGSPFVYYGEEIGAQSYQDKDENKRLPMLWSSLDTKGIANPPADADPDIEQTFPAVDSQLEDENSILNYYKRALKLRNQNPELARGTVEKLDSLCTETVGAMTKTYNGSTIAIIFNNGEEPAAVNIAGSSIEDMALRGYVTILPKEEVCLKDGQLSLPSRSYCVLKFED